MQAIEPFCDDINFIAYLIHEGRVRSRVSGSQLSDWLGAKDFLGIGDRAVNARIQCLARGSGLNPNDPKVRSELANQAARDLFKPRYFNAHLYFRFPEYRAA